MAFSSLISKQVLADPSNYTHSRKSKICKITPHHAAGVMSATAIAKLFQNPKRNCSATYCIGNDGEIVGNTPEECRPWTSSSGANDHKAITIEVSNCEKGGRWKISNAAWNSLVNLCVDICKRYNFRLTYDGTPNGSLTRHNMFSKTACPGPYLQDRFPELAQTVNAMLDAKPTPKPTPQPTPTPSFLPARGYFKRGDVSKNIGKIASFMRKTFPRYTKKAALGNLYGPNLIASIKEFQRRTGLVADGFIGPLTLAKLKAFGFKY